MGAAILGAGIFSIIVMVLAGKSISEEKRDKNMFIMIATLIFVLAFAVRILIGYFGETFHVDMNVFKSWARITNEVGFKRIYREDIFLDYPPGYLYILVLLDKIKIALGLDDSSQLYTLIMKIPSILGDMFCAGIILYTAKKKLSDNHALLLSAIYLFCPIVIINSARWGQADSFCLAILLLSVMLLYRGNYIPSSIVYGLSIVCKPQMLVFIPLYVFVMIKRKKFAKLLVGISLAFVAIMIVAKPFTKGFDYIWLINKYKDTMDYYSYYTVNAYNFWALIGYNWRSLPETGILSTLLSVAGPIIATVLSGILIFKSKHKGAFFMAPVILMATTYQFAVKMHERYLYPIFIFFLLAYVFARDKRILYAFAATAFANYLNVRYVFYLFEEKDGKYSANEPLVKVFSAIQVAAYLYVLWVTFWVFIKERAPRSYPDKGDLKHREIQPIFTEKVDSKIHLKDIIVITVITTAYAVVAFWGLGSHTTANTSWLPEKNESAVIKTAEPIDTMVYMIGIEPDESHYQARISDDINVEISTDNKKWEKIDVKDKVPEARVYTWVELYFEQEASYIRITANDDRVTLNEVAFKNFDSNNFVQAELISNKDKAVNLLNEQSIVPAFPTYYDSMYFDEIYHARTAYEHILNLEPYENTHPPLGKMIISVGIRIFGMNPFGWRFMGVLFGVLMLPVLYHILKQLFGSTFFSAIGVILFAFDFMHFTQTRISTIDTYAVFFILLMYDAMIAFMRKDIKIEKMSKILLPLALSGIFMGVGIASKWTVVYGAVGLAVLLFIKLIVSYTNELKTGGDISFMFRRGVHICLWCCLLFIAIPFGIYFAVYLPMTTLPHNNLATFFRYQETMFNYHSNLDAEHFFSSKWYEWPFDVKPVWFYKGKTGLDPASTSTISTMGNPILWWSMIPAMIFTGIEAFREKSKAAVVALVGFLSVYLPWVIISRIAFIYHYFTAVPFLIIGLIYTMIKLSEISDESGKSYVFVLKNRSNTAVRINIMHIAAIIFVLVNLAMFVMFLPVISGFPTSEKYIEILKWLPKWYF